MLEHSTRQLTLDELISLQEGSPVNHSAQLGSEKEQKTRATCGPQCLESFGRLNQATLWARTFADYLIGQGDWYSKRCALTWKLKGTKSHRIYFQLAVKTLPIEEIESGLLLTPTSVMTDEHPDKMRARVEKNGYKNGTKYGSLVSQVKYSGMLPTPTASDFMSIDPVSAARKAKGEKRPSGATIGSKLGQDIRITNTLKTGKTSQLNPLFVEEMIGFPKNWTVLPFQSGEKKASKPTETQSSPK